MQLEKECDIAGPNASSWVPFLISRHFAVHLGQEYFSRDIQGGPKKTWFSVFANISANTYSRETSRLSTKFAWQDGSNDMRLDFLRYLVHEKIDILGEILTLIERSITPLRVLAF